MTIKDYSHYNDAIFYHAFLQSKNIKPFLHINNNSFRIFQKLYYYSGRLLHRKLKVVNKFNIDINFYIDKTFILPIYEASHICTPLSWYRNRCVNGIKSYTAKNKNNKNIGVKYERI